MARYSHFAHVDAGQWRRKLSPAQQQRVVRMKDERGLTYSAIAYWFTRNGTPITYGAVAYNYRKAKAA